MNSPTDDLEIRVEEDADGAGIGRVHDLAFGQPGEGVLVERMRGQVDPWISVVAELGDEIVGHVLFTPVTIEGVAGGGNAMGLGPMGVAPDHQRQGVGSALVRAGMAMCDAIGCGVVFVLGHPEYYPRFGFEPAALHGLHWERPGSEESFFVAEIEPRALDALNGIVRYHSEFSNI